MDFVTREQIDIMTKKPICIRKLTDVETAEEVTVFLFKPEKCGTDEWKCSFCIKNRNDAVERQAYGSDSFHALYLALEGILAMLDQYNKRLSWSCSDVTSDHGFRKIAYTCFGANFDRRIASIIDGEIYAEAQRLTGQDTTITPAIKSLSENSRRAPGNDRAGEMQTNARGQPLE